jgi:hypothetical protein
MGVILANSGCEKDALAGGSRLSSCIENLHYYQIDYQTAGYRRFQLMSRDGS